VVIVKIKKDKEVSVVMVAALRLVPKFIPSIFKCPVQSLKKAALGFLPSERHFDGQHKFLRCRPWRNDQRKTGLLVNCKDQQKTKRYNQLSLLLHWILVLNHTTIDS